MGTATIHAGGDLFRNFHQAEKRQVQVDWAGRLIGTEEPNGFTWYVPSGLSAVASATAFTYGFFNSATASGANTASASASAMSSGTVYSQVTLSGQANFATGMAYPISGSITTDGGNLYIEAFLVWSWNGLNVDG
jgi:hypothetical protein